LAADPDQKREYAVKAVPQDGAPGNRMAVFDDGTKCIVHSCTVPVGSVQKAEVLWEGKGKLGQVVVKSCSRKETSSFVLWLYPAEKKEKTTTSKQQVLQLVTTAFEEHQMSKARGFMREAAAEFAKGTIDKKELQKRKREFLDSLKDDKCGGKKKVKQTAEGTVVKTEASLKVDNTTAGQAKDEREPNSSNSDNSSDDDETSGSSTDNDSGEDSKQKSDADEPQTPTKGPKKRPAQSAQEVTPTKSQASPEREGGCKASPKSGGPKAPAMKSTKSGGGTAQRMKPTRSEGGTEQPMKSPKRKKGAASPMKSSKSGGGAASPMKPAKREPGTASPKKPGVESVEAKKRKMVLSKAAASAEAKVQPEVGIFERMLLAD
jgi:hypothetical protein